MEAVTPRQAVRAHLLADQSVSSLVGSRIHHVMPPQDEAPPLIVINTISNTDRRDLAGVAYVETRLQVTVIAKALAEAETVAMAVRLSLEGFRGLMAGALPVIGCRVVGYMPIYQPDVSQTHYHVDIIVTHDA